MNSPAIPTGDLALARLMLCSDMFLEGHGGIDPDEHLGTKVLSEPGIASVNLNGEIAELQLARLGWARDSRGAWLAPDGEGMYWSRSEALLVALTAEVV